VDRHQRHPEQPRLARQVIVVPRVRGGLVFVQEGLDRAPHYFLGDAGPLEDDSMLREDLGEVHLGSPTRGVMINQEVVPELLRDQ